MSTKATETGDNSNVFQADKIDVNSIYINNNEKIKKIKHCGNCQNIIESIKEYKFEEFILSKNPYSISEESCGKFNVDDKNKYLVCCLCEVFKEREINYINHDISYQGEYELRSGLYEYNEYVYVSELIKSEYDVYLLFGEAGVGKSTFLKRLYIELIFKSITSSNNYIPVLLNCYNYDIKEKPYEWFLKELKKKFENLDFERILKNPINEIFILLDAFNEIPYINNSDLSEKIELWSAFIKEMHDINSNIKFIISSRHCDSLQLFKADKVEKLHIKPLNENQIIEYINNSKKSPSEKEHIISIYNKNKDIIFYRIPFFLTKLIELSNISHELKNKSKLITFYLNTILLKYHKNSRQRNIIIRSDIQSTSPFQLIELQIGNILLKSFLCKVAYNSQLNNYTTFNLQDFPEVLEDLGSFLELTVNTLILKKEKDKDSCSFSHPILQEYFAALYILNELNSNYDIKDILRFNDKSKNIEVVKHLYNMIDNKDNFIQLLIENDILYAAYCVIDDTGVSSIKESIIQNIVDILKSDLNDLHTRKELGLLLGNLGDVRIGTLKSSNCIEPYTTIPLRNNKIGVAIYPVTNVEYSYFIEDGGYNKSKYWKKAIEDKWLSNENDNTLFENIYLHWNNMQSKLNNEIIDVLIKKYKFDKELCACLYCFKHIEKSELIEIIKDLYGNNSKPLMWDNPEYNNPSLPIVGVCVYEAFAYCEWLSEKTNKHYRLLTCEEWENICYKDIFTYVYGNTFDYKLSNTLELNLQCILPVGIINGNSTSDGIYDLCGNIFEWTSTMYSISGTGINTQYICKGGAWLHDKNSAKSEYIGRGKIWCKNIDLGFRVCVDL